MTVTIKMMYIQFPFSDISEDFDIDGKIIHLSMLHNPSHLEVANPASMGKARSKQQTRCDGGFSNDPNKQFGSSVINVQVCSSKWNERPLLSFNTRFNLTYWLLDILESHCENEIRFNFSIVSFMVMLHLVAKE